MKTRNVILIIVGIFILAGGVVYLVLRKTDQTLKQAQATAAQAAGVTGDIKEIGMGVKKAWTDIAGLFG